MTCHGRGDCEEEAGASDQDEDQHGYITPKTTPQDRAAKMRVNKAEASAIVARDGLRMVSGAFVVLGDVSDSGGTAKEAQSAPVRLVADNKGRALLRALVIGAGVLVAGSSGVATICLTIAWL